MIVHHNHFLLKVKLPVILLVEVFDGVFVGGVGDVMEDDLHPLADGPNDGHVVLLLLGSLDDQRQHRILGLPDLVPDRPHVCGGFVHVDDLPISSHVADYLLDILDSQSGSLLLTPGAVEARVGLQIAYLQLLIVVGECVARNLDIMLLLQYGTPGLERQMGLFSQSLGIFQHSCDLLSQDLLPLLLLWEARNHSIIDLVLLNDLVHGGASDADLLRYVGDGHPHRLKLPVPAEPELDNLDLHGELDAGPLLQELFYIFDWQICDMRVLIQQNAVGGIAPHLAVVFGSALELGKLFLFPWFRSIVHLSLYLLVIVV